MINAGKASSIVSHLIFFTELIIKLPTMMSAGEVIAATSESALTSGLKKEEMINRIATVNVVKPVRPPTATPEEDSTKAVVGLVPNIAPTVVATESESRA